ncbi:IgGFc-binding protein-like [Eucyclogobius newberryi]|uniref:IgGFc-binding protein-like n=1 Tax=Eucyclogobius newberryi TaxID=166745 RepID=UPI003B5C35C7
MGDPHYKTFDGRRYDFMGTCTYVIAKNCMPSDNLPAFEVLAQNENRGNVKVSYVGLVIVKVYDTTIIVARSERGYVRIDNNRWALPVTLNSNKLVLSQSGRSVVIDTDFGLSVRYDWEHSLVLSLSPSYSGKTCGLCGNFNGNSRDDFTTPSGNQAGDVVAFGSSWKVPGLTQGALCRDDCVGNCETCEHKLMTIWEGNLRCGLITKVRNGPFSKCHSVIDPQAYFENCKYDICMGKGQRYFLCKALETYSDACQSAGIVVSGWRRMAKCPSRCPANSQYELCGSACPATCSDPDAPSKCKRPCIESCTCRKGFLRSGNRCVPAKRCGCTYNGRYVPARESFWADQNCQKWCRCDPKSQKVDCKDKGCRNGEQCQVVDGIRKCAAISAKTCQATGDPHYKTFDGKKFDFQGTCVYQLTALCSEDPELVPFEVYVQNNNRGNKAVSYTKLVEVKVFSISIVITQTHKGRILLNNELVNLPISLQDGDVNVYKSGMYAVVHTNFGLKVIFNWQSAVFVTLPSVYMGAVCGLCGNYNDKPADDLIPKNGNNPANPADFGASWRVAEIPGCVDQCKGNCPDCDKTEMVQYEKEDFCGIIRDPTGPFRDCHAKVDPAGYFEDCVYDVCLFRGRKDVLCQSITTYTSACQAVGAEVYSWRTSQFCAMKCPVHSHYEVCADACPATCQSLSPPENCKELCKEDCACDDGYILSRDKCVESTECGCVYEERYYTFGQVFYPNGQCEEECKCGQDGEVECKKFSCGPNEKCAIENGVQKCHPVGKGVCQASGDPHYTSFDGRKFDFQGTCTYILSQSCGLEGTHLTSFSVQVLNEEWPRNRRASVTKLVAVKVYDTTFIMRKNMFGVLVNGILNNLPLNIMDGAVLVYQEGTHYVIETDFGLRVSYNLIYLVTVTVPGNYRDKVCGLCGNFNGKPKDDFKMPNEKLTDNVNTFGKSWKVNIPNVVCSNGCEGNECPNCDEARKAVFSRSTYCGIITAPQGPFSECHSKLDPQLYFDDCVFDVCASNGEGKVLCDSVAAYALNCQIAGVDAKSWRSPSFCPMKCPANSHYEVCADSCSAACPGLTEIVQCPTGCTEGCECDAGFMFNGQTCVKEDECGCYDQGTTYKPGEVVYNEDCTTKCMCNSTTGLVCENHSCPRGTNCTVKKGIQGCYNTDPCKDANCRVKEKCRVEKGEAVCVPEYTGVCWAWGDPHYHTFDKYNFDFQGTCRYVISKTCGDLDGLVPFSITERNDNRGNRAVSYVREVEVSVYGYSIIVRKNQVGKVTVDGDLLNLPVLLDEEDTVVSLVQQGNKIKIKTDFGLTVTYDWNQALVIRLPSSYYNHVCGLCSNFNGNRRDELQNPAGKSVSSIVEWAKSWQTPEQDKDSPCWDTCEGNCPTCDDDQRKLYETEAFCGALTTKVENVFQKCHDKVDPDAFMKNCVFDMCLNNGDKKMLCQALASYIEECRDEGIIIQGWRKKFGCPMNCQRHSHFEECASPCQPSCPFPEQKEICTAVCVETCVCDEGYVLSAGVCVPEKTCGCSYQGRYYKPGQQFWEDQACRRLCDCDTTLGMVICKDASCSANEQCTVVDGVRGCTPTSYAICRASGDPHYRSFDGRKFDFQGTCVYQLVALCSRRPGLVPFTVNVQNEHRGNNKAVSITKSVTFSIYGATITISRDIPNKILLNGQLESLPLVYSDDLKVYRSGKKAVVETTAGITLTFDWRSTVTVTLPSNYQDAVCGLCGNYNGRPQDDLTMRNGQTAANGEELGESWLLALVPGCSSVCQGPWCHACTDSQKEMYRAQKYCGIIADKDGPFKECHSVVDPAPYLEDCVFDACQYNGHSSSVCEAISAYASACQSSGITVLSWRTEDFCPMVCPANSHYTLCAMGCPETCASLTSVTCKRPCTEACECDEGFLLSGDVCVPVKDCGCSYDGHYYKIGDIFYPEDECVEKCTCGENGAVSCENAKCRPGETCRLMNGVKGCHPEGQAKCVASGDPHYISFDGRRFDFQGTCVYVLAKVCDDDKGQLTPFTVTQGNEKYGNGKVAVTKSVTVAVYGFVIYIQQRISWKVIVNDELVKLPLFLHDGRIQITQEGRNIIVRTDFGLTVLYDTVYYVEVIVPSSYVERMCGLCGNYNKNPKDDFMLPNGKPINNVDEFGKAWVVDLPGFLCGGCGGQCPVCDEAKAASFGKPESCGIISAPNGPFKACHSKIDPATYFSHCVFDVCAMDGNKDTLCNSVLAYALACQSAGVQIKSWRTDSFCPGLCPKNSHYELCADTCGVTCANLMYPVTCSKACFEGCQCDQGLVFDGVHCVSMGNCGCEHNGRYLTVGETVVDPECKSKCVCKASGTVKCQRLSCDSGKVCEVRNGVRDCHVAQGQCIINQDGLLSSFDGMTGPMGALGAFEVASLCNATAKPWFRVVVDVRSCMKGNFSVETIYVFSRKNIIAVNSLHEVWVNGRKVSLPLKVSCDIYVHILDGIIIIEKASVLQIKFSISLEVTVIVDASFSYRMCGACGNYNHNSKDDMMTSDGKSAEDVSAVVRSWRADDFSSCTVKCGYNLECQMIDGSPMCVPKPKTPATCWAMGDPHYETFDGRRYDFMGTCTYVIAKNCMPSDNLPAFEVLAQNENRGNVKVSYVGLVIVKVYDTTIIVARSERGYVRIDNNRWALPVTLNSNKLVLSQSGRSVVIDTDFGLSVRYDWEHSLVLSLSPSYSGKTCGLCGNFNGNSSDDFTTPSGNQAGDVVAFGSSWKVPGLTQGALCRDDCVGNCETCEHKLMTIWEGDLNCGLITMVIDGPFSKCHSVIGPQAYFENCKYDICMGKGQRYFLCKALETYSDACQSAGIVVSGWRKMAKCPPRCPANSQYELCGSACPATCSDPDAPSKCKRPCIESCTCRKGFLWSGNRCVQAKKCGCTYNGCYVPPGESFWADQNCQKWCRCDPKSQKVDCKDKGCRNGEQCQVVDGIRKCAAISVKTCQATGDPHYKTFDGKKFDFQGTCVYQLTALCSEDPELVPFEVYVQNNNRGNKAVSLTKLVEVKVFSISIVITQTHKGRILVNNELVNLPISLQDGDVNVYKSGMYAVVHTNFGLKVIFNWQSAVFVTLPSVYMGAVCGLCGNYNDKPADDLIPKNGNNPANPADFGASWRVAEIPGCVDQCKGNCPDCDITEMVQYEKEDFCGIIRDPTGPFRDCHAKVDPAGYFEDCVYDVCLFRGRKDVLCQSITSYTSACQAVGAEVYSWRTGQCCAMKCPVHSHYEVCADACPATCQSLSPPENCKELCKEDCACDDGYILSGDKCVESTECGCVYEERYYTFGQVFYPNGQCEEECKCGQDGEVECKKFSCGPNEKCAIENGVQKCHPVGKGVCQASGDPHYTSFDGRKFDFQGTCTYILSQSCGLEGTHLTSFSVQVLNEEWPRNRRASVTKLVAVKVYDTTFIMRKNMFGVLVNGILNNLPLNIMDGAVLVYQEGTNYVIETDFGLRVSYNLIYLVTVTVPGNYRDKVCGLCGNFNGKPTDDFKMPNENLTDNVNTFGKSWKVNIPNVVCSNGCEGNECPNCDEARKAVFSRSTYCGIITAPQGPFSECHSKLDPQLYFDDCVFDVCASNGEGKVLCDSVAAYALNCQIAGVDVKSWRSPSFCPMKCPANSHYEVCADSCSAACPGLTEIVQCPTGCTEGCECDAGFMFNGQTCVKEDECGCYDQGTTYKPGEVVYNEDCTTKCMCNSTTGLVCENHSCPQGTNCTVKKGIQGCYNTDPCKDANCRVKEKCRVEKGEAVCVPEYTGVCWAWGDPHYHTFDKYNFDFQGTCRYVISKTCGDLDGLVPYSITERNDNRGNRAVSYVREVEVSVYGYSIIVRKNQVGKVTVDGDLLNLPVLLDEEDTVVSLVQQGNKIKIKTDFGLTVTYDWNQALVIRLPSSYYNHVCGLCGNFNGNRSDELQNPAGKSVSSIVEWAKSWQTPEQDKDSPCWDTCEGNCPTCDDDQRKLYETEAFCGALTTKVENVFQKCHDKVDPEAFMKNCVFDMCLNNGDKKMLCQALASYIEECRDEGIIIQGWRKKFGCPMNCQRHSHFEECASPCQPSCPFPEQKEICTAVCVETCVCDEGYVLSAGVCVPEKTCGCSYQGRYYKPGQQFWEDQACRRLCDCDTTLGMVICKDASCSANEQCTVVDGVRGCTPTSYAICRASGDPHYRSFDGRKFDFQGTCVYQLVALCSRRPGLVPFTVNVQNEHRGNNKAVSITKSVTFSIYGATITISRDIPNKILLNGQLESLPLVYSDDLKVYRSGKKAVVETTAGITLTFDWRSTVTVTLPSNYQGAVCGLCGNYNGRPQDDLTMRNGQTAANGEELGESWLLALVPGCSSVCQGPWCHACTDSQKEMYRAQKYCGIIADKDGPFKECHSVVDPAPYLEDCVFDACQYNGHSSSVCEAISAYASACQSSGITVLSWRTEDFCPMVCPANSHYTLCATGCPETCASLTSVTCKRPCTEACECDEGFLLSGDVCVPVKDCGCSYDGHYYKIGDIFYPEDECVEKCTCGENGAVSCENAKCRPGETCRLVNGVKGCHPEGQAKCVASGDPHYISFDGRRFDFQGTCVYVLAKVCDDDKGQLTPFTVTQGNEKYGNGKVAVTKSVTVAVYGFVIYIQQRISWKVIVNDELVKLPLFLHDGRIQITQEGRNIIVRTDFGLTVLYDTVYYVEVIVPSSYVERMCGLCGNYNKNPKDDFMLPNGKPINNVDEFGKAWVVDLPGFLCGGCGGQCPVCDEAKAASFGKPESCGIISAPNGPFKDCHSKIDPATYFSHCVFDVCAMDGNKDTLCNSVLAYALACQSAGVQIQSWRTDSFCPGLCPKNSHYELCADTCGVTCANLMYPVTCSKACFEGCQCDQGLVFDGVHCVSMGNCGCEHNGRYLTVGETVVDPECKSKCVCKASGTVKCQRLSCDSGKVCEVRNGVRDCHVAQGQCIINQDGLLSSFDGMTGPMGALGAFEVASLCNVTADLWFRVVVDVRSCRNETYSVDIIYIFTRKTIIVVNSLHEVWVNGRKVSLPLKVSCDIYVHILDGIIIIEKASVLQIKFSISLEVTVIVDASFSYRMCGACGNYNHNSKDDMMTSDGKSAEDVSAVVRSWSAGDFSICGL